MVLFDDVLQAVISMAEAAAGVPVVTGSMPPDDGIAMTGQASVSTTFRDIGSNQRMNIVCNGKNRDQAVVIRQLDAIHRDLTRRKDYPAGDSWMIYSIETASSPRLIGREQNSEWLYGSSLLVKINYGGI